MQGASARSPDVLMHQPMRLPEDDWSRWVSAAGAATCGQHSSFMARRVIHACAHARLTLTSVADLWRCLVNSNRPAGSKRPAAPASASSSSSRSASGQQEAVARAPAGSAAVAAAAAPAQDPQSPSTLSSSGAKTRCCRSARHLRPPRGHRMRGTCQSAHVSRRVAVELFGGRL